MGSVISYFQAPSYSVDQVPDLTGKIMVVTGGNSGIGKETVKVLLQRNATVYMAARSEEKAQIAINDIAEVTGKRAIFLQLDLASLTSVKKAAEQLISLEPSLHVVFNNAGLMKPPMSDVTEDGYDIQFGTMVLGHFYFNKLLLPVLMATSEKEGRPSRIIVTSSIAARLITQQPAIAFDALKDGPVRRKGSTITYYLQAKLGNLVYAKEMAKRYGNKGVITIPLEPGNVKSGLFRHLPWGARQIYRSLMWPTPTGALNQLYAGTSDEALELNGKFIIPWTRLQEPNALADDPELGEALWKWLEEQVDGMRSRHRLFDS